MINTMTATRHLTVNAAFLKEIKDDNLQLKALWDRMLPLVCNAKVADNHWSELIGILSELRDQLALHFSLEEAYGYFDQAIEVAPRLSLAAETLKGQHSILFADVRDLADDILEVDSESEEKREAFLARLHTFKRAFEAHEESELKLILASLDDDIGVGD